MNHKTLKSTDAGTSLVAYFDATRREIEAVFGAPSYTCDSESEKVTVEWVIEFENGTIATIYDWKRYEEGTPALDEEYEWHIGGVNSDAAKYVSLAMQKDSFDFDISAPNFRKTKFSVI